MNGIFYWFVFPFLFFISSAPAENLCLRAETEAVAGATLYSGHPASHAIDNDDETYAMPKKPGRYNLFVDLHNHATINSIYIKTYSFNRPARYRVRASSDLYNWTTVISERTANGAIDETFNFSSCSARYVMFDILETSGVGGGAVRTFHVFGMAGNSAPGPVGGGYRASSKPMLAFKLDNGMTNDFLYLNKDDKTNLVANLQRLWGGLDCLTNEYRVAIVYNPPEFYSRTELDSPIVSLDPGLLDALDWIEDKSYEETSKDNVFHFYLVAMASDVLQLQDGGIGWADVPPLYRGGADTNYTVSIDLTTARELKCRYPKTFQGVYFHELFGTDLKYRRQIDPFGQFVTNAVIGFVDLCDELGMELVWGDHAWRGSMNENDGYYHFVDDHVRNPDYINAADYYADSLSYAVTVLSNQLCFLHNNNNYHPIVAMDSYFGQTVTNSIRYFQYDLSDTSQPFYDLLLNGARSGMSDQIWFFALAASSLVKQSGVSVYNTEPSLYCPVELLTAFAVRAITNGGNVIHFDLPYYFFRPDANGVRSTSTNWVTTYNLERFVSLMNNPDCDVSGGTPMFYFDNSAQKLMDNSVTNRPKKFNNSQLIIHNTVFASTNYCRTFDFYNNEEHYWEHLAPSMDPNIFGSENLIRIERIRLTNTGCDDIMLIRTNASGMPLIQIITHEGRGSFTVDLSSLINYPSNVIITAANVIQTNVSYASGGECDADELIILENNNGSWKWTVCQVRFNYTRETLLLPQYSNPERLATNALKQALSCSSTNMRGLFPIRRENSLQLISVDGTNRYVRALDQLGWYENDGGTVYARYKKGNGSLASWAMPSTHPRDARGIYNTALCDTDCNGIDEMIVMDDSDNGFFLKRWEMGTGGFSSLGFAEFSDPENIGTLLTSGKYGIFGRTKTIPDKR